MSRGRIERRGVHNNAFQRTQRWATYSPWRIDTGQRWAAELGHYAYRSPRQSSVRYIKLVLLCTSVLPSLLPGSASAQEADTSAWKTFGSSLHGVQFRYPPSYELEVRRSDSAGCGLLVELRKSEEWVHEVSSPCHGKPDSTCVDTTRASVGTYIDVLLTEAPFEEVAEDQLFERRGGVWFARGLHEAEVDSVQGAGWRGLSGYAYVRFPPPGGIGEIGRELAVLESAGRCKLYFSMRDELNEAGGVFERIVESARAGSPERE